MNIRITNVIRKFNDYKKDEIIFNGSMKKLKSTIVTNGFVFNNYITKDMVGIVFDGTIFSHGTINDVDIIDCHFINCEFRKVKFYDVYFENSSFEKCKFFNCLTDMETFERLSKVLNRKQLLSLNIDLMYNPYDNDDKEFYGYDIIYKFKNKKSNLLNTELDDIIMKIGCKKKTIKEWNEWFYNSTKEYNTKRSDEEFQFIINEYEFCKNRLKEVKEKFIDIMEKVGE